MRGFPARSRSLAMAIEEIEDFLGRLHTGQLDQEYLMS